MVRCLTFACVLFASARLLAEPVQVSIADTASEPVPLADEQPISLAGYDMIGDFEKACACDDSVGFLQSFVDQRGRLASRGISLRGWVSQGVTLNSDDPVNRFNTPVTFNDRSNEYQANQVYMILEKEVDSGCSWDIGGRIDVLFGSDYFFTTATGLETHQDGSNKWNGEGPRAGGSAALYGIALPQAYVDVHVPVAQGVDVRLGHFYTIIGHESVMAPENFFYSHAYTMQYGEPFTHTGMLATTSLASGLSVSAGITRGWDTWENPDNRVAFLGGIRWTSPDQCSSLALSVHTGDESGFSLDNRTVSSLVYSRQITDRFRYVLQSDFGVQQDGELNSAGNFDAAKWYGVNQYFLYDINECWSLGTRFEWFRDQDNSRVLGLPFDATTQGGNYYGLTVGLNWSAFENLTIRPELRYDWSDTESSFPVVGGPYDFFTADNQFLAALDVVLNF